MYVSKDRRERADEDIDKLDEVLENWSAKGMQFLLIRVVMLNMTFESCAQVDPIVSTVFRTYHSYII